MFFSFFTKPFITKTSHLEKDLLTLFYMGGGSNRPPLTDYCTLILGGCPEWTDFS